MLHMCIPRKDGHEALREYNHFSCGDFATVHNMKFIKKELSCLTTSTIPNTTPDSKV